MLPEEIEYFRRKKAGRRPGHQSSKPEILKAARLAFATEGYSASSLRSIAAVAGVEPSTIIHFFGSKEGLYEAVIADYVELSEPLFRELRRHAPGRDVVRAYISLWEQHDSHMKLAVVFKSAMGCSETVDLIRRALRDRACEALPGVSPERVELALSLMIGAAIGRHILHFPHLEKADRDALCKELGTVVEGMLYAESAAAAQR